MSQDHLILIQPGFVRPGRAPDARFACPDCNGLEGLLATAPAGAAAQLKVSRVPFERPAGDPQPLPYLDSVANRAAGAFDITLEVSIQTPRMREAGLRRIDGWDVRCLGSLIELFPDCVPRSWRHATLHSDIAEPSGEWRVRVLPRDWSRPS